MTASRITSSNFHGTDSSWDCQLPLCSIYKVRYPVELLDFEPASKCYSHWSSPVNYYLVTVDNALEGTRLLFLFCFPLQIGTWVQYLFQRVPILSQGAMGVPRAWRALNH